MSILKPRTGSLVVYQGDDLARLSELKAEADRVEREVFAQRQSGASQRVGDEVPTADAERDAYAAFVHEAAERAVSIDYCALGSKAFRDLVAAHPPRMVKSDDGEEVLHDDDAGWGVNTETFPMALLTFVDDEDDEHRTIIAPEFPSVAKLRVFLDRELAAGDFEQLWTKVYFKNRAGSADPKASLYSTASQSSDETTT